ncbi:MAG: D-2-hydroxyacid dehydrogenase [Clostridia bacterium]|nr:D-2-hydroxyacid dehydrogenase [Clostridia bacterium]
MKIVVLDGYTLFPGDLDRGTLDLLGEVTVYDRTPPELVTARIGDAPVVLTNKTKITREVMQACPQMRYIGVLATGYNVVDIEAASACGVTVTNVPAYSTQAVAQHTMALLLASASRVHEYDAAVKRGAWSASPDFCFYVGSSEELAGKTMGIVGFGSIGRAVARAAAGFGMHVIAYTRTPRPDAEGVEFVPLQALLERSDVISLHCPLTEKTQGIIGCDAIAAMKDGVRVINTARGPLVDEAAMARALESGKAACYMADVLGVEPPAADNPLLRAPRTIITPHVAWAPRQTRERLRDIAAKNVQAFLSGCPQNVING